jgi:hypothetical protein
MRMEAATLGGVEGRGYALIDRPDGGFATCAGVFAFAPERAADLVDLVAEPASPDVPFDGVLIDGETRSRRVLRVKILDLDTGAGRTRFKVSGDPYAGAAG